MEVVDWIPVSDRYPTTKTDVLVLCRDRSMFVGCLVHTYDFTGFPTLQWHQHLEIPNTNYTEVTHWMPLPEPPDGE